LAGLKVLIADDEPVSRLMLQRAVQGCGHDANVVANGAEALQVVQTSEFDVVITDWVMPFMDGLELCRRVRERSDASYTYIIVLTALGDKAHFLEGMEAGADDYLAKPFDTEELRARLIAAARVMDLHQRLARQNAELADLNRALEDTARNDPLTGLGNRLRLREDLEATHSRMERYGAPYALALCDVDHFKAYNDRFGHPAGDTALRAVAQTIAAECRMADRAYRYGGEEFLVLLPAQAAVGAANAVNRMRQAVQALAIPHIDNTPAGVLTISGGIAVAVPKVTQNPGTVIAAADASLYQAKAAGRNRIMVAERPAATGG
jgi:two-component system, cell cycle response regulator